MIEDLQIEKSQKDAEIKSIQLKNQENLDKLQLEKSQIQQQISSLST